MFVGDVSNVVVPGGKWQQNKFSLTRKQLGVVSGESRVVGAIDKPMLVSRVN